MAGPWLTAAEAQPDDMRQSGPPTTVARAGAYAESDACVPERVVSLSPVVILLAVLSAACNAGSTVLQRLAAGSAPPATAMHLSLFGYLLHRRIWLIGMAIMIASFLLQAAALQRGALAVVQPLLLAKLPITVLTALLVFHGRLHVGGRDWFAVFAMWGGLALVLVVAMPTSTGHMPTAAEWWITVALSVVGTALTVAVAARHPGPARAALLGAASGVAFGLVAAFIKAATESLDSGVGTATSLWPFAATVCAGLVALVLQQNALQAGSLAASQPASMIVGTVTSVGLGILLFEEDVRVGSVWPIEVVGIALVVYSILATARSPLVTANLASGQSHAG